MQKNPIYRHVVTGLNQALSRRSSGSRRIGAELKFPLVRADGGAVRHRVVEQLWQYLAHHGWTPVVDELSGNVVGAKKPGPHNSTVASCETGFCKVEFSLAHVGDLWELHTMVDELLEELRRFSGLRGVYFLGYGIHPVTRPGKHLLMKKARTSVWDKVFRSNRHVPAEDGDDMHLFTVNAATHVHLSVSRNEVVPAVNVLNGFAGPQIALTAHSNVWKGALDHRYRCVAEKFWEWWIPEEDRVGMPAHPFADLREYCRTVAEFQPVYVKRDGEPVALPDYDSFADYFATTTAVGVNSRGERVVVAPQPEDIALHNSCYWFNARLSRYHTVENRVNDQQPPGELLAVPALTLGLISALGEAEEELRSYDWSLLQEARRASCRAALRARVNGIALRSLASRMLDIADRGLRARNQGEEAFLEPLQARIRDSRCPADETAKLYRRGGISALLTDRAL